MFLQPRKMMNELRQVMVFTSVTNQQDTEIWFFFTEIQNSHLWVKA
jgi:hypothetical protein